MSGLPRTWLLDQTLIGRVTENALGPGASARHPSANATLPWLGGLKLGYRIGLTLELLRLSASG